MVDQRGTVEALGQEQRSPRAACRAASSSPRSRRTHARIHERPLHGLIVSAEPRLHLGAVRDLGRLCGSPEQSQGEHLGEQQRYRCDPVAGPKDGVRGASGHHQGVVAASRPQPRTRLVAIISSACVASSSIDGVAALLAPRWLPRGPPRPPVRTSGGPVPPSRWPPLPRVPCAVPRLLRPARDFGVLAALVGRQGQGGGDLGEQRLGDRQPLHRTYQPAPSGVVAPKQTLHRRRRQDEANPVASGTPTEEQPLLRARQRLVQSSRLHQHLGKVGERRHPFWWRRPLRGEHPVRGDGQGCARARAPQRDAAWPRSPGHPVRRRVRGVGPGSAATPRATPRTAAARAWLRSRTTTG